jgi:hypothetical protein
MPPSSNRLLCTSGEDIALASTDRPSPSYLWSTTHRAVRLGARCSARSAGPTCPVRTQTTKRVATGYSNTSNRQRSNARTVQSGAGVFSPKARGKSVPFSHAGSSLKKRSIQSRNRVAARRIGEPLGCPQPGCSGGHHRFAARLTVSGLRRGCRGNVGRPAQRPRRKWQATPSRARRWTYSLSIDLTSRSLAARSFLWTGYAALGGDRRRRRRSRASAPTPRKMAFFESFRGHRFVPVTTISTCRPPHREHTSRSRQSRTDVSAPYRASAMATTHLRRTPLVLTS